MSTPEWPKVRVWWVARHRRSGVTHLAASGFGNYKFTRCGLRMRVQSRDWRMFAWERVGNDPPSPTCGLCLRRINGVSAPKEAPKEERRSNVA